MQCKKILGESGGTKTDWAVIIDSDVVLRFQTASFHPQLLTSETIEYWLMRLSDFTLSDFELFLFSAGCFQEQGRNQLQLRLMNFSFKAIHIQSDLAAATLATNHTSGWVAILGTGSALIHFDESGLSLFGGKGWEIGDEGSGFYFGKLVVEALRRGETFREIKEEEAEFLIRLYRNQQSKSEFSALSKRLKLQEIKRIHEQNIDLFFEHYIIPENCKSIHFVGGYACSQKQLLQQICDKYKIEIISFIQQPIVALLNNRNF